MNNRVFLIIIILVGALLRFYSLSDFPAGFTADEAGQAYTAFSLLKTGRDEWGEPWPIFPRNFGDYKPPLLTYLMLPTVQAFGLSEFAARAPTAFLGSLTPILIYLITKKMWDKDTAFLATLFAVFSPWFFQASRVAFEGSIGVFFFLLSLTIFIYSLEKTSLIPLAFIAFGLTSYSYHSFRMIIFLFIPLLVFILIKKNVPRNQIKIALATFMLLIAPTILNFNKVLIRSSDVSVFSEKNIASYFLSKTPTTAPPLIARFFDNKYRFLGDQFFSNYISYFSPDFYFTGERGDYTHLNFPSAPLLYPFELPIFLTGLYFLLTKKSPVNLMILAIFLISPIPAALTEASNAQRAITIMPATILITAAGLSVLKNKIKTPVFFLLISVSFLFFGYDYFFRLHQRPTESQREGYKESFTKIFTLEDRFSSIHISKRYTNPQMYLAFYKKWDPVDFQAHSQTWKQYEQNGLQYIDQLPSYSLGKYYFHDINWTTEKTLTNALIVGTQDDFLVPVDPLWEYRDWKAYSLFMLVPSLN